MSRTWRVATNDTASENANIPRNRSVKPQLPFRLKHPVFQAKLAERISPSLLTDEDFPQAQEFVIFDSELYIARLAVGK